MGFSADSKIGELLNDPRTKAVLEKHLPGVSKNALIDMARGMSLRDVAEFPPAEIPSDKLNSVDAELKAL